MSPSHDGDIAVADLLKRAALELGSELRAAAEFYSTSVRIRASSRPVWSRARWPRFPDSSRRCPRRRALALTCGEVIAGER